MSQSQYLEDLHAATISMGRFNVLTKTLYQSKQVKVEKGCYAWFVINLGDVLVTVDEFPLLPRLAPGLYGGFFGAGDNKRLYGKEQINIVFTAGGTDPRISLTQMSII